MIVPNKTPLEVCISAEAEHPKVHLLGLFLCSKWSQQSLRDSMLSPKDVPSSPGRLELRVCSRTFEFSPSPYLLLLVALCMAVGFFSPFFFHHIDSYGRAN